MISETPSPVPDRTITIDIKGPTLCGKSTIAALLATLLAAVFEQNGILVPISISNGDGDYLKVYSRAQEGVITHQLGTAFRNLDKVHIVDGEATEHSYIGTALPGLA